MKSTTFKYTVTITVKNAESDYETKAIKDPLKKLKQVIENGLYRAYNQDMELRDIDPMELLKIKVTKEK